MKERCVESHVLSSEFGRFHEEEKAVFEKFELFFQKEQFLTNEIASDSEKSERDW